MEVYAGWGDMALKETQSLPLRVSPCGEGGGVTETGGDATAWPGLGQMTGGEGWRGTTMVNVMCQHVWAMAPRQS